MKIVLESPDVFATATDDVRGIGGAERQMWLTARGLARAGHRVVVYTRARPVLPDREIDGVTFRWIAPVNPVLAWQRILDVEQPDLWYYRCADFYLGFLPTLAHRRGVRVVYAVALDADCQPPRALSRRPYLWPLYAFGLHTVDRILVQHSRQVDLLPHRLRSRARWVPSISPVESSRVPPEGYVAWVGDLREIKRPHLLIDLASMLPEVRFVVCGGPSMHRTSREYAETIVSRLSTRPNLELRGAVPPSVAHDVIRRSSLLLSTSAGEGFPNTFLQAWGAGVPVVSLELDPGGVIGRENAGVVAESVDGVAEAVRRLVTAPGLAAELGERGRRFVRETHEEGRVVARLLGALED